MFENQSMESIEMRESVKRLALREIPKFQNEQHFGTVPLGLFRAFAEMGLTGLAIEEGHGGIHASSFTTQMVIEEIAAVDCGCAVFLSVHSMVSALIQNFGSSAQKQKYLAALASGKLLAAFALTEPSAGSNAANLRTIATPTKGGYMLNGEKCYITSAGFADLYVVFARLPQTQAADGICAFIVEKDTPGLKVGKVEHKMGAELSPIASLNFENLELAKENRLGGEGKGYKIANSGLSKGRINIAACANGISRSAIELSFKHLQEREQFGQKLIEFQGLQFMLADMRIKLEAARLMTVNAAMGLDKDQNSRQNRIKSSMAKCFATDAAMSISTDAVQLLGGAGYIRDYQVERLMRDAKMLQIVEGTNQIQRVIIAKEMILNKS